MAGPAGGKADDVNEAGACEEHRDNDADFEQCMILQTLPNLDEEASRSLRSDPAGLPGKVDADGAKEFDFCTDTGNTLNLKNAAWLAFVSSNVYAHPKSLLPVLSSLGFGRDADLLSAQCYGDLATLLALEAAWAADPSSKPDRYDVGGPHGGGLSEELSICGRNWYETEFANDLDQIPAKGLAGQFESYLVTEADSDSRLQFFSGGEFKTESKTFEKGSTQAVWMEHNSRPVAIVGFRGTEPNETADWVVNLEARRDTLAEFEHWHDADSGKVQRGFNRAVLASVGPRMLDKIDSLEPRDGVPVEVWVTGHSLGGALGTMFTSILLEKLDRGENVKDGEVQWTLGGLYTFGSPRVGNDDFFERLTGLGKQLPLMRFRNHDDVITRTPGAPPYKHIGEMVYFDQDGDMEHQPEKIIEPFIGSTDDHSMATYYDLILEALDEPSNAALVACP
ncbi:MAG: lipase family protein [Myxococcota bacterium]